MSKLLRFLIVLILFFPGGSAQANSVSDALYEATISVTNSTGSNTKYALINVPLSSDSLLTSRLAQGNLLDLSVHDSAGNDIPAYPGTTAGDLEYAKLDDGGVFTDETANASSPTTNDVVLLPVTPVVGDAFYLGFHNQARLALFTIDTAGEGTWTITWEYYNGTVYSALSNVVDGTEGFTNRGLRTVSYNMPTDWESSSVDGDTSWWIRGRVSSFTSITTPPVGSFIEYETAQLWIWVEAINDNQQLNYTIYTRGSDLQDEYSIIGTTSVSDNASLELGNNSFILTWEGFHRGGAQSLIEKVSSYGIRAVGGRIEGYITDGVATSSIFSLVPGSQGVKSVSLIRDASGPATMTLVVNGVVQGSSAVTLTATDNGNPVSIGNTSSASYTTNASVRIGSTDYLDIQQTTLEEQNIITDNSASSNDGTIAMPNPLENFTVSLSAFAPVGFTPSVVTIEDTLVTENPILGPEEFSTPAPGLRNIFGPLITLAVAQTGYPETVWYYWLATMFAIAIILGVFMGTGGNFLAAGLGGFVVYSAAWRLGLVDIWMVSIYLVAAIGILSAGKVLVGGTK